MKKFILISLLITITVLCFTACDLIKEEPSDEEKIEICIMSFTEAYNDGDVEKAMEYMTGAQKNAIKSMLNLVGIFTGYDASTIFASVFSLGVATSDGDFMEVEIIEISIDGEEAEVSTKITFPDTQQEEDEISYFHLKKKDGQWLITDITD